MDKQYVKLNFGHLFFVMQTSFTLDSIDAQSNFSGII